jgi:predicted DNA-binding transcriptional regulator AlpA
MMKAKELAPLLGLDPKTLYAKSAIPGATRMAGSVRWDCYIVAEWLRQKAKALPGT